MAAVSEALTRSQCTTSVISLQKAVGLLSHDRSMGGRSWLFPALSSPLHPTVGKGLGEGLGPCSPSAEVGLTAL